MINRIYANAKHYPKLDIEGLYNGMQPIRANYKYTKKELKGNDYLKLYGALVIIAGHNADNLQELFGVTVGDTVDDAAIQDDELYLNCFVGYELNERYTLRTLFLSDNDVVMMSVYDSKKDDYIDFVA